MDQHSDSSTQLGGINFTLLGNSLEDADGQKVGNGLYVSGELLTVLKAGIGVELGLCCSIPDNRTLVKDVMMKLTMNKSIMKSITRETEDYTNHKVAMQELANDQLTVLHS